MESVPDRCQIERIQVARCDWNVNLENGRGLGFTSSDASSLGSPL